MNEHDETILAAAAVDCDDAHGAVMPPLYLSSNYSFVGLGEKRTFDYARSGNPNRSQLGDALAALERGAGAVVVNSGMAAIDLVLDLLPRGALVLAPHDCYGGAWRLLNARAKKHVIFVNYVNFTDPERVTAAFAVAPALVLIETPSNPLMRITDIAEIVRLAKATGALVAVDNTFLSPVLQKPLTLGADFVIHSTTKYLNGHSDVVGGAVVAANPVHVEELAWWANCTGVTAPPFDCWLTLRGLRTLSVRMERQEASARALAEALSSHDLVARVCYPGLASHPGHDIAVKQQSGFGAMLSIELADGASVARFVDALRRFTLAESLGGIESLLAHPATMTHASMSAEAREIAGIGYGLLRLSIGLEHVDDLRADLANALLRTRQKERAA